MPDATPPFAVLVIRLGTRRFGLLANVVRQIVRAVAVAPLPRAPAIVEGVINYRGTIVPVFDVRARFRLPAEPLHPDQHFILARAGPRLVALRVDRAEELVEVPQDRVEAAAVAPGAELVAGIAALPDGLVVIHDLPAFLSLEEAAAVDAALASAGS